jgi:Tfp pilus assembly protein PilV
MFERLSARLRPADPAEREAGLGIVEVVVALLVFAVITTGSIVAVGTVLSMTADNRSREVAANLASQAVDTARSITDISDIASGSTPVTVNGTDFTVTQSVSWITTTGLDSACAPANAANNGSLLYKRLNVTVTWKGMRTATGAVRSDTVVAPGSKINDPERGTILVTVKGSDGAGVSGVTVTIEPDSGTATPGKALDSSSVPGLTNADGCAVATKVVPGSYKITLSRGDGLEYRDPYQSATPTKTGVNVAKGDTTGQVFTYSLADDYTMNYVSGYTGTALKPAALDTTIKGANGTYVATSPDDHEYLYPLSSGYQFIAGKYVPAGGSATSCLSPDPSAWPRAADGKTGKPQPYVLPDTPVDVPMGVVTVKLASGQRFIKATTTTAANGDPGCAATMTYTFTLSSAASQATIALPYGTWRLQAASSSTTTLSNITLGNVVGSILGTLFPGTGSNANVVTLDPRTAP